MTKNLFEKSMNYIYKHYKDDTSKMLIATGTIGWILSAAAQLGAILHNKNISNDKKSFLIPQEIIDGVINVGTFLAITLLFKKGMKKLIQTGKLIPQSVRTYLDKNPKMYKEKIGKIDFNLDNELAKDKLNAPLETYNSYKNFAITMGTVGSSILACNVVTPIIRNKYASKIYQTYNNMYNNTQYSLNSNKNLKI